MKIVEILFTEISLIFYTFMLYPYSKYLDHLKQKNVLRTFEEKNYLTFLVLVP